MGGRGGSSASAAASRKATSTAGSSVAKMSDEQLDKELRAIKAEMDKFNEVMAENASGHTGYLQGTPWGNKADHEAYVEAFNANKSLTARRNAIVDEQAKRKHVAAAAQRPEPKTFVNSFGEATHRYITSPTYERAQKRLDKMFLRNTGY